MNGCHELYCAGHLIEAAVAYVCKENIISSRMIRGKLPMSF
ncbi:MAG: hypothetical protein ACOCRZ_02345 [Halothermotrichaceae bacterium]